MKQTKIDKLIMDLQYELCKNGLYCSITSKEDGIITEIKFFKTPPTNTSNIVQSHTLHTDGVKKSSEVVHRKEKNKKVMLKNGK